MTSVIVRTVPTVEDRALPVFAELEKLMDHIRDRAYHLSEARGFEGSFQLDDWLRAEHELCWPAAELDETDEEFIAKVALAGFDPEDITVTANPHELIVKAKHELKHKVIKPSIAHWSDFQSNDVYRHIQLPSDIDVDKISARFSRGMLTIEAPKADVQVESPQEIEISSAA